jgi:hypothetical protein
LVKSERSHSYDGSEIRETWYIEPADAETAFIASMLGRVDPSGNPPTTPLRVLPAAHYLFPWCLAAQCDSIALDERQITYCGPTNPTNAANAAQQAAAQQLGGLASVTAGMNALTQAVGTYNNTDINGKPGYLWPRQGISTAIIGGSNSKFSAGVFVTVTYLPVLNPFGLSQQQLQTAAIDAVNWSFTQAERLNVLNSGIRLLTPPSPANINGKWKPEAGISPVFRETYQVFAAERRMLLPTFMIPYLSQYKNSVNTVAENINGTPGLASQNNKTFPPGTLRFSDYRTRWVQVPQVDQNGEPSGYNRWLDLTLYWDWRTTLSAQTHGTDGTRTSGFQPVQWNHVLVFPGLLEWLAGASTGMGWYLGRYATTDPFITNAEPYPNIQSVLNPQSAILDPLTMNW